MSVGICSSNKCLKAALWGWYTMWTSMLVENSTAFFEKDQRSEMWLSSLSNTLYVPSRIIGSSDESSKHAVVWLWMGIGGPSWLVEDLLQHFLKRANAWSRIYKSKEQIFESCFARGDLLKTVNVWTDYLVSVTLVALSKRTWVWKLNWMAWFL